MIVEDDRKINELIRRTLTMTGHKGLPAFSGREALRGGRYGSLLPDQRDIKRQKFTIKGLISELYACKIVDKMTLVTGNVKRSDGRWRFRR